MASFEYWHNSSNKEFPHCLYLVTTNEMFHVHSNEVAWYCSNLFENHEYEVCGYPDEGWFSFKTKEQAMLVKLGWEPQEWITVSGPGW